MQPLNESQSDFFGTHTELLWGYADSWLKVMSDLYHAGHRFHVIAAIEALNQQPLSIPSPEMVLRFLGAMRGTVSDKFKQDVADFYPSSRSFHFFVDSFGQVMAISKPLQAGAPQAKVSFRTAIELCNDWNVSRGFKPVYEDGYLIEPNGYRLPSARDVHYAFGMMSPQARRHYRDSIRNNSAEGEPGIWALSPVGSEKAEPTVVYPFGNNGPKSKQNLMCLVREAPGGGEVFNRAVGLCTSDPFSTLVTETNSRALGPDTARRKIRRQKEANHG